MEMKMNKFTAFAAAGIMATTALFAFQASADDATSSENENSAFAQMVRDNTYDLAPAATHASSGYAYGYKEGTLTKVSQANPDVTVYRLRDLSESDRSIYRSRASAEPARVAALQAKINATPSLRSALLAENVQISSVIGKVKAADGSTAYIVR